MKSLSPTDLKREAVVIKDNKGWVIKVKGIMGIMPLGPRLGRRDGLPNIPRRAQTRMEAEAAAQRWNHWLAENQTVSKRKGRKRR